MSILKMIGGIAAAAMMGVGSIMPPIGGRPTPTFAAAPEYDGAGRKKKAPRHPRHNAKRRSRDWSDYARKVTATHSDREDPRADKYLHAHARMRRAQRKLGA